MVQEPLGPTWGFFIFRAVYTPESDVQFPLCIRTLNTWIKCQIYDETYINPNFGRRRTVPWDAAPNSEMWSRYKNEIVEGRKRLDGADVIKVRGEFKEKLRELVSDNLSGLHTPAKLQACIMIDKAVMQSIMAAPAEPPSEHENHIPWVKLVQFAGIDEEEPERLA